MVKKWLSVAPSFAKCLGGSLDGVSFVALVLLNLGQHNESICMKCRIRTPLNRLPHFFKPLACFLRLIFSLVQLRQRCQGWQFFFNQLYLPRAR
jgi:hypothetical protein